MSDISENEFSVQTYKNKILNVLIELEDDEKSEITEWICSGNYKLELQKLIEIKKNMQNLSKISSKLSKIVPLSGTLPNEELVNPKGVNSDCNEENTAHIDEFIYDNDSLDDMVTKGKASRHYCTDCKSRNIQELQIISHSFSKERLAYVFNYLLPKDLSCCYILDIGSRLGAVLFGAYYFTNCKSVVGVEISPDLCDLQTRMIESFKLDKNRIQVHHSDILNREELLHNSDYIIMNNVFEFFSDVDKQKEIWAFLRKSIRDGTHLISVPSVEEVLDNLGIAHEYKDWLEACKAYQMENEVLFDVVDGDFCDIFFYKVRNNSIVNKE